MIRWRQESSIKGESFSLLLVFLVVLGLYVVEELPLADEIPESEVVEVFVGDEHAVVEFIDLERATTSSCATCAWRVRSSSR